MVSPGDLSSAIHTLASVEADQPKVTWPHQVRPTVRALDCGFVRLCCVTTASGIAPEPQLRVSWEARGLGGDYVGQGLSVTKEGAIREARALLMAPPAPDDGEDKA